MKVAALCLLWNFHRFQTCWNVNVVVCMNVKQLSFLSETEQNVLAETLWPLTCFVLSWLQIKSCRSSCLSQIWKEDFYKISGLIHSKLSVMLGFILKQTGVNNISALHFSQYSNIFNWSVKLQIKSNIPFQIKTSIFCLSFKTAKQNFISNTFHSRWKLNALHRETAATKTCKSTKGNTIKTDK